MAKDVLHKPVSMLVILVVLLQHVLCSQSFSATRSQEPIPRETRAVPRSVTALHTRSTSQSESAPFDGGLLAWADARSQEANVEDSFLQERNWTGVIQLFHDEFDEVIAMDASQFFRLLNVTLVNAVTRQPRSPFGRSQRGFVINERSLHVLTPNRVSFTLLQDEFVQVTDEEVLAITFAANATRSKIAPKNHLLLRITSRDVESNPAIVISLTASMMLTAALTVVVGMPGLHQIQSIAAVGAMTCTNSDVQAYTDGAADFLAPIPLSSTPAGRLGGNVILAGYVGVMHIIAARVIRSRVARMSLREAMSRTYFPSIPYAVTTILFPGFVFFCVRFAYQIIDGGLTVIVFSAAFFSAMLLLVLIHVLFTARSFLDRRFVFNESGFHGAFVARLRVALGTWGPPEVLRMYRSVLWPLAAHSDKFMLIAFAESVLVFGIAGYQPGSRQECRAQYGLLALFTIVSAVVYLYKAPYRYLADNILASLASCSLLVMCMAAAIATEEADVLKTAYQAAIGVGIFVACARCFAALVHVWHEAHGGTTEPATSTQRKVRVVDHDSSPEIPLVDSSSGLDDD